MYEAHYSLLRQAACTKRVFVSTADRNVSLDHNIARFAIDEHQSGTLLRLCASGTHAPDLAVQILELLISDFEAEIEDAGWRDAYGAKFGKPVLAQLESLAVDLTTDGEYVEIIRQAGSQFEFDELCQQIQALSH